MKLVYVYMDLIAPSFILLPIFFGSIRYKALPPHAKVLFYYLIVTAAVSAASSVLANLHRPNMPLLHIATVLETIGLLYFFILVFSGHRFTGYIRWLAISFPLFAILNAVFFQNIFEFNSYMLSLQSLIVMGLCFLYFWHAGHDEGLPWGAHPLNWIASGLLLYFSSAFILFTFSNFIIPRSSKAVLILLWDIHATLTVVMNVFICIGISKYRHD